MGDPRFCHHPCAEKSAQPRRLKDGRDGGWGEERQGCWGSAGGAATQTLSPWSQHPQAREAHTLGQGRWGLRARLTPSGSRFSHKSLALPATLANRLYRQHPREILFWGLCSAALGGGPDQRSSYDVRNQGALLISEPPKDNLILKLSEGFSSLSAWNVLPLLQAFFRSHLLNRGLS